MLTLLRVVDASPPRRRWWQLRRPRAIPTVAAEGVEAPGVRYRVLTATRTPSGTVDWVGIAALAGADAARLLLPDGVRLPSEAAAYGLRPFAGYALAEVLLQRALWALLRRWRLPPQALSVGLYDPAGRFTSLPPLLLPRAADVRVVTAAAHLPAYGDVAARAMADCGATLQLSADPARLRGVQVLLAPDGADTAPPAACTLTARPTRRRGVVDGYLPGGAVAAAWLAALPPDAEAHAFLAAAYECGVTEVAHAPPAQLRLDGGWCPPDAAARRLCPTWTPAP